MPLFGLIAFFLITRTRGYSARAYTISQSIKFLSKPHHTVLFRVNFLLKALLDLGFALYLLHFFSIPFISLISLLLIGSAILFGSLAYFIEGKHSRSHLSIVYISGLLWAGGQLLLVQHIGSVSFRIVTYGAVVIPILIAFWSLFTKKTNVAIQVLCISIWYVWIASLVFCYL